MTLYDIIHKLTAEGVSGLENIQVRYHSPKEAKEVHNADIGYTEDGQIFVLLSE